MNLVYAEEAVKYAESILRGRASNRPEDIVHSLQSGLKNNLFTQFINKLPKDRYTGKSAKLDAFLERSADSYHKSVIDAGRRQGMSAEAIKQRAVGNCHENAILV